MLTEKPHITAIKMGNFTYSRNFITTSFDLDKSYVQAVLVIEIGVKVQAVKHLAETRTNVGCCGLSHDRSCVTEFTKVQVRHGV